MVSVYRILLLFVKGKLNDGIYRNVIVYFKISVLQKLSDIFVQIMIFRLIVDSLLSSKAVVTVWRQCLFCIRSFGILKPND